MRDPKTGKAICFACKVCEKSCPSDCISVEGTKREGEKRKSATEFRLDFTKCSLCGSCVEACRSNAIRFSREYNLAGTRKEDFIMDLFQRLEKERLEGEALPPTSRIPEPISTAEPPPSDSPKPEHSNPEPAKAQTS